MNVKRRKKLLTLLGVLSVIAVAVVLIGYAIGENLDHFYTPTQIVEGQVKDNQRIKVGGLVKKGSVKQSNTSLSVSFDVTDNNSTVRVTYDGILPDLFREGQGIVAHGLYLGGNTLGASKVVAKHDENYMPPEAAQALMQAEKANKAKLKPGPEAD